MKTFTPFYVALRIAVYSLFLYLIAEFVRFDALYPMEDGYYGELSFVEISQEIILFLLFVLYIIAGRRYEPVQPVTNLIALLFLASFIREFNFLISWWFYLVLPLVILGVWLIVRDYKKMGNAVMQFFSLPASAWFLSGFLITFLFSRLMGRSSFWRILYDESTYRLAKAGTEEGLELAGDGFMLISAVELLIWIHVKNKSRKVRIL